MPDLAWTAITLFNGILVVILLTMASQNRKDLKKFREEEENSAVEPELRDILDHMLETAAENGPGENHGVLKEDGTFTVYLSVYKEVNTSPKILSALNVWAKETENQEVIEKLKELRNIDNIDDYVGHKKSNNG